MQRQNSERCHHLERLEQYKASHVISAPYQVETHRDQQTATVRMIQQNLTSMPRQHTSRHHAVLQLLVVGILALLSIAAADTKSYGPTIKRCVRGSE